MSLHGDQLAYLQPNPRRTHLDIRHPNLRCPLLASLRLSLLLIQQFVHRRYQHHSPVVSQAATRQHFLPAYQVVSLHHYLHHRLRLSRSLDQLLSHPPSLRLFPHHSRIRCLLSSQYRRHHRSLRASRLVSRLLYRLLSPSVFHRLYLVASHRQFHFLRQVVSRRQFLPMCLLHSQRNNRRGNPLDNLLQDRRVNRLGSLRANLQLRLPRNPRQNRLLDQAASQLASHRGLYLIARTSYSRSMSLSNSKMHLLVR